MSYPPLAVSAEQQAMRLAAVTSPWSRQVMRLVPVAVVALLAAASAWRLQLNLAPLVSGVAKLGWLGSLMWPPSAEGQHLVFLKAVGETLGMAVLGVFMAAMVALPLSCLAARSLSPSRPLRVLCRRFFDMLRGVDVLLWAMVCVSAVGLGPFAGVLAIAAAETGVLGKLFADALDDVPSGVRESVLSTGANRLSLFRYGILPQSLPVLLSQVLYYLESNVRSATILGIVGAGGIGFQLADRIRVNEWQQVSWLLLLILALVIGIDRASAWLSQRWIRPSSRVHRPTDSPETTP